jgi:hypothetical protein
MSSVRITMKLGTAKVVENKKDNRDRTTHLSMTRTKKKSTGGEPTNQDNLEIFS